MEREPRHGTEKEPRDGAARLVPQLVADDLAELHAASTSAGVPALTDVPGEGAEVDVLQVRLGGLEAQAR